MIKGGIHQPVDPSLLSEEAERNLFAAWEKTRADVSRAVDARDYGRALELIAGLRIHVDCFFEDVMVMAEDEAVKNNRLALLTSVSDLFSGIADFSRIA